LRAGFPVHDFSIIPCDGGSTQYYVAAVEIALIT